MGWIWGLLALALAGFLLPGCSSSMARPYSCTDAALEEIAALEDLVSRIDSGGRAVATSSCDSYSGAGVSGDLAGLSISAAVDSVRSVFGCEVVDPGEIVDGLELQCRHAGNPVAVLFEVDPARESVSVFVEPLRP